jgi:hypothetical protein
VSVVIVALVAAWKIGKAQSAPPPAETLQATYDWPAFDGSMEQWAEHFSRQTGWQLAITEDLSGTRILLPAQPGATVQARLTRLAETAGVRWTQLPDQALLLTARVRPRYESDPSRGSTAVTIAKILERLSPQQYAALLAGEPLPLALLTPEEKTSVLSLSPEQLRLYESQGDAHLWVILPALSVTLQGCIQKEAQRFFVTGQLPKEWAFIELTEGTFRRRIPIEEVVARLREK